MKFVGGELTFDKTEAQAIENHIHEYGLSPVGIKIKPNLAGGLVESIEFIGSNNLTLYFKVEA